MTNSALLGWGLPVIVTIAAAAALTGLTGEVSARGAARSAEETAPRDAGEPIMAIVSIKSQHVTFYDADGWILKAPVSTGVKGRETPAGVFAVLQKNIDHRSNLYDDAHMPHMQRLTWNGIALHGGPLPGYAASHGCVRMPYGFASEAVRQDAHRNAGDHFPGRRNARRVFSCGAVVPDAEAVAAAPAACRDARARRGRGRQSGRRDEEGGEASGARGGIGKGGAAQAGTPKSSAEDEIADAEKAIAKAKKDEARARAEERKVKAAAKAAESGPKVETAKADAAAKIDAAAKAAAAAKEAATRKAETAKAADEAKLALDPVSIYISRATQKLYVRRNTLKPWPDGGEVFDATIEVPVTIRDPERPIGTHVFTAMAQGDAGLRWTAVTIDNGDDAKDALDRVTIPQDVLDRIAPTALPRSSIIVSDEPLSRETNYRTEFVAVLSNQPQGGFKTRKPTPPVSSLGRSQRRRRLLQFLGAAQPIASNLAITVGAAANQWKPGLFWQ